MNNLIFPVLIAIALWILGFVAGLLFKSLKSGRYKKIGRFVINENDPTKSAFWLELDHDLDVIERQDTIGLQVFFHNSTSKEE